MSRATWESSRVVEPTLKILITDPLRWRWQESSYDDREKLGLASSLLPSWQRSSQCSVVHGARSLCTNISRASVSSCPRLQWKERCCRAEAAVKTRRRSDRSSAMSPHEDVSMLLGQEGGSISAAVACVECVLLPTL